MQFPRRAQLPARRSGARGRDAPLAWLLITPAMIGFAFFIAYPTLRGTYLAFTPKLFPDWSWRRQGFSSSPSGRNPAI